MLSMTNAFKYTGRRKYCSQLVKEIAGRGACTVILAHKKPHSKKGSTVYVILSGNYNLSSASMEYETTDNDGKVERGYLSVLSWWAYENGVCRASSTGGTDCDKRCMYYTVGF